MKSYMKKGGRGREESTASSAVAFQRRAASSSKFIDNRSSTIAQRQLIDAIGVGSASPVQTHPESEELQMKAVAGVVQREGMDEEGLLRGQFESVQRAGIEEEELLQGKFEAAQRAGIEDKELLQGEFSTESAQKKPDDTRNISGLPDNLKAGVENLSGYSMDDVKVYYNSGKPSQLNAHAYAQGTDIHVAAGQEQHLPHEAWHVAQQKQGRVRPTTQMKGGMKVNDDTSLEKEADVMGAKANQYGGQLTAQRKMKRVSEAGSSCQLMMWTWLNGDWYSDDFDTANPKPTHTGKKNNERYDDGLDVEAGVVNEEEVEESQCPFGDEEIVEKRGMSEDEARQLADYHDMEDISSSKWTCSDKPHSPKGKVYKLGSGYYGADNTGHVGFCFKIWSKAKKGKWTLDYEGNITHNLRKVIPRG